jgi:hypothetical protein
MEQPQRMERAQPQQRMENRGGGNVERGGGERGGRGR